MRNILSVIFLASLCSGAGAQITATEIVGAWNLVTVETRDENGDWHKSKDRYGIDPIGYITYSATGEMAVQICNLNRPDLNANASGLEGRVNSATDEALRQALLGYTAYFGTYDIDSEKHSVTHNRTGHWIPDFMGDSVERFFIVDGDRLILIPVQNENRRLIWRRVSR
jgi:hypothetical protein